MQGTQKQARTETRGRQLLPMGQAGLRKDTQWHLLADREGGVWAGLRPAYLHAVSEHDAHGHKLGEDLEELGVGQHAVLQAVVQEACVVPQHVIDVGGLHGTHPD